MGNQQQGKNNSSQSQKIVLKLRSRDIILHYSFRMKVTIADIDMFPHELSGLRLWDVDIILSRYIILESQSFNKKDVLVFKAGVGIAGIALRNWTDAAGVTLCDSRDQIIGNMKKNCERNGAKNVNYFKINFDELSKSTQQYDKIVCPDLLGLDFHPQLIINIFRRLLKIGGQGVLIMPENKEIAKKLLSIVDKKQFKITNLILTAEEYQTAPLFNKLDSEKQFPLIGKVNFYAIILEKISISQLKAQKNDEKIPEQVKIQAVKEVIAAHKQEVVKQKPMKEQIPQQVEPKEVKEQRIEQVQVQQKKPQEQIIQQEKQKQAQDQKQQQPVIEKAEPQKEEQPIIQQEVKNEEVQPHIHNQEKQQSFPSQPIEAKQSPQEEAPATITQDRPPEVNNEDGL